ncbi:hypothetical protein [Gynuella sunshinyii]|uniref:Uncharacterized protein n=1 Tax=Gynuella sunshinyii YC6258 TaxID=1445510 RepID=A0A0C5VEJ6_9GAMM|nr:hypothetical protein [Gynuella sunshinyii]AJQ92982.1 hypothetical Protein YC6258_00932 [Gynuella sunshinyii YC6258]
MAISGIQSGYSAQNVSTVKTIADRSGNVVPVRQQQDTVSISTTGKATEIMSRYDLTQISANDAVSLSDELYQSGVISFQQHSFLSFQPELGKADNVPAGWTNGNADAPGNLIADWENELSLKQSFGADETSLQSTQQMVDLLHYLDSLG